MQSKGEGNTHGLVAYLSESLLLLLHREGKNVL